MVGLRVVNSAVMWAGMKVLHWVEMKVVRWAARLAENSEALKAETKVEMKD